MKQCPRCGRNHSGICGIPAGVTLGFGARVGSARQRQFVANTKPKPKYLGTETLETLLVGAKRHLKKVMDMLIYTPPELPEYTELLDSEAKLNALIKQLIGQIAARR